MNQDLPPTNSSSSMARLSFIVLCLDLKLKIFSSPGMFVGPQFWPLLGNHRVSHKHLEPLAMRSFLGRQPVLVRPCQYYRLDLPVYWNRKHPSSDSIQPSGHTPGWAGVVDVVVVSHLGVVLIVSHLGVVVVLVVDHLGVVVNGISVVVVVVPVWLLCNKRPR